MRLRALLAVLLLSASAHADVLRIYHMNDSQGRLQRSFTDDGGAGVGGMSRIVRLLADLRSDGGQTLFLDGGDALGAAALSEFDGGRLMVDLLTQAGLDAAVVGNHEFDYGLDTLRLRAYQAGYPFLGANVTVAGSASPVRPYTIVERQGRRIGLIGVIAPTLSRVINPQRNPGLALTDPAAALDRWLPELADSTDWIIGMAHMPMASAMALASSHPEVTLWVLGGDTAPSTPHDVQLSSGTHLITTPGGGRTLGAIEVEWPESGPPRGPQITARLLPVADELAVDEEVLERIRLQRLRFEASRSEVLATVVEPIDDAMLFVADIVRTRADAEACVLNRGTFREHTLAGVLTLADVDRLVRYEDDLVVIELTGKQLRTMDGSSQGRQLSGQKLVWSGFDPAARRIDGRALHDDETYRVATTGYLAGGGDDYLSGVVARPLGKGTPLTLSSALIDHLRRYPQAGPRAGIAAGTGSTWKSQTKLSGSLSRTGISADARRYSGVSFLSGSDAMTWNSIVDSRWTRESAIGVLALTLRSTYGQVREGSDFRESADRLQVESVYTWERINPAPFLSADVNSVWSVPSDDERPLTIRASAGIQRPLGAEAKVRLGLGLEHDVAAGSDQVGLELVPEFRRRFGRGNSFSTSLKVFAGATETRKISAQHYNNLLINLKGNLYVTVDANFFVHRDDLVGDPGLKSEVQIGFGYTIHGKWI